MLRNIIFYSLTTVMLFPLTGSLSSQKLPSGADLITAEDLETHVSFLSSPLLKGRRNGEPGLAIAQEYLTAQAKLLGLKPAGDDYFQTYTIISKEIDYEKTMIRIINGTDDTIIIKEPVYQFIPTGPSDFKIEGEVVFAGYGLQSPYNNYDDFDGIETRDKILLIMNRAPSSTDGSEYLFKGTNWSSFMSIQEKLNHLLFTRAKAILIVMDPKSGYKSLSEQSEDMAAGFNSDERLKGQPDNMIDLPGMPKILFVHRVVADEILKGTGHSLDELQKSIDSSLKPNSFQVLNKTVIINEASLTRDIPLHNIAAYIEGSDPVLKNEYVIFSAHADHIGTKGGYVNPGADDNASGCSALLSLAKAFQSLEKKPLRSILFLWVSGEEIGLYGSRSYVQEPLVPLENTIADLNLDMIGRVRGVADSTSENPMTDRESVFLITDNQSKDLVQIADEVDKNTSLDFDYSLSGNNDPLQLFARSDHFNFVKEDIPILFFTSGLHSDYHSPGDSVEKIDFSKMEKITQAVFHIGYNIANRKNRVKVDNPYSKWGRY